MASTAAAEAEAAPGYFAATLNEDARRSGTEFVIHCSSLSTLEDVEADLKSQGDVSQGVITLPTLSQGRNTTRQIIASKS